jgi:hypothetical protein
MSAIVMDAKLLRSSKPAKADLIRCRVRSPLLPSAASRLTIGFAKIVESLCTVCAYSKVRRPDEQQKEKQNSFSLADGGGMRMMRARFTGTWFPWIRPSPN